MPHTIIIRKIIRPLVAGIACVLVVTLAACDSTPAPPPTPGSQATPSATAQTAPTSTPVQNNTPASTTAPTEAVTTTPPITPTPAATNTPAPTDTPAATNTPVPTSTSTMPPATPTATATATEAPPLPFTWKQAGLSGTHLTSLALLPGGNNIVLVGSPQGVWRSQYDYTKWDKLAVGVIGGNPPPAKVDVQIASPGVLYIAGNTGCASGLPIVSYRSTDGGKTWASMNVQVVSLYAANAAVAYAATCQGAIKTADSGATWSKVLPGSEGLNYDAYAITGSPDGESVYMAYASEGGSGLLKRSADGGKSWKDITPKNAPDGELRATVSMMFVPGSEGRPQDGGLYMANGQGTWFLPTESDDWKVELTPGSSDANALYTFVTALYVDTTYTEEYKKPGPVIYEARTQFGGQAPVGLGVFRSINLGATWQRVGDDLGQTMITGLALAPHDTAATPGMIETLLASTGNGVWAVPMPPPFK